MPHQLVGHFFVFETVRVLRAIPRLCAGALGILALLVVRALQAPRNERIGTGCYSDCPQSRSGTVYSAAQRACNRDCFVHSKHSLVVWSCTVQGRRVVHLMALPSLSLREILEWCRWLELWHHGIQISALCAVTGAFY